MGKRAYGGPGRQPDQRANRKKAGLSSPPGPTFLLCSALHGTEPAGELAGQTPSAEREIRAKHPANACSQGVGLCREEMGRVSQKPSLLKHEPAINHLLDLLSFSAWELQLWPLIIFFSSVLGSLFFFFFLNEFIDFETEPHLAAQVDLKSTAILVPQPPLSLRL